MAYTKISDVVFNTMFDRYLWQQKTKLSAFVQSGVAVVDPRIAALCNEQGAGGKTVNMPFWNPIGGDAEVLSDTTPLTLNAITAGQDVAVILRRGKAWGLQDLAAEIAGDDPIKALADKLAPYWSDEMQTALFATLKGIFLRNVAVNGGDLVLDISGEPGKAGVLGPDTVLLAKQKLGDAKGKIAAIAMHSQAETALNIVGNAGFWKPAENPALLPTYNGLKVIMDDGCAYDPATGKAEIYLFAPGAVALNAAQVKTPVETSRDALQGVDQVVTRRGWINHVRGYKWNGNAANVSPTNTELATAANWDRVWDRKNIGVVKLVCNLFAEEE